MEGAGAALPQREALLGSQLPPQDSRPASRCPYSPESGRREAMRVGPWPTREDPFPAKVIVPNRTLLLLLHSAPSRLPRTGFSLSSPPPGTHFLASTPS